MKTQYIIIEGNVVDGLNFYGPYNSHDEAVEIAEENCADGDWSIAELTKL